MSHKPTGFGTFTFVSCGSCALAAVALTVPSDNPFTLLSAIVTGIGFLGAGALIKSGDRISGFTTAASIWIFAIFGLLVGLGQYTMAFLEYAFVWAVLALDRYLEKHGIGSYRSRITLCTTKQLDEKELQQIIGAKRYRLEDFHTDVQDKLFWVTYSVEGAKDDIKQLPKKILEKEWFKSFRMEPY
ncbi:MAG: MgtC/SapB family protein [Candidatus Aenigmatarchaeota archaeon]